MKSVLQGYWGLLKGEKVHIMGTLIIIEWLWDSFVRLKHPLQYCQYIPHIYYMSVHADVSTQEA